MTLRKNIIASWLAHVVTLLIGFYSMPLIMHALGDDQYGAWLFINSVASYSGLLYLGFGATICRETADAYARRDWQQFNVSAATVFTVYAVMSVVVLVAGGVFSLVAPWLQVWEPGTDMADVQRAVLCLGVSLALGMVGSAFGGILVGTQRIDIKRGIEVAMAILRLALLLICLKTRPTLTTMSLIFFASTAMEVFLYIVFSKRQVPTLSVSPRHLNWQAFRHSAAFSLTYIVGQFAEQLIYMTDTVVIGLVLGAKAVVPYYIALRICQLVQQPIAQIGEAFLPKAGHLHAAGQRTELSRLLARMAGLCFLLAAAFWIGAAYFSPMLIRVWLEVDAAQSYPVLMLLLAAQVTALPIVVFRKGLLATGDIRVQTYIDLAEAVANLVLSVALAYAIGRIGVAWGTLIPLAIVETCVLLPYAARKLHVELRHLLFAEVGPQLIPLGALLVYCEVVSRQDLGDSWRNLLAITAGGGAVLGASWLLIQKARHLFIPPRSTPNGGASTGSGHESAGQARAVSSEGSGTRTVAEQSLHTA